MRQVTVADTTLRDGAHPQALSYTAEQVARVAAALGAAGVPVIEVTHGYGLRGSSRAFGEAACDDVTMVAAAREAAPAARVAVLVQPGLCDRDDLAAARDAGAQVARVAVASGAAASAAGYLEVARELGMIAVGFLMLAHRLGAAALAAQAQLMADSGAQVVYVVDSAGALLPEQTSERIAALRRALPSSVAAGFHAHDNLGLGVANALAAVEAGASWVDSSLRRLGAGAGNAATEALAAALERRGVRTGIDLDELLRGAEAAVDPILRHVPNVDTTSVLMARSGLYFDTLAEADELARRAGLPAPRVRRLYAEHGLVAGDRERAQSLLDDVDRRA